MIDIDNKNEHRWCDVTEAILDLAWPSAREVVFKMRLCLCVLVATLLVQLTYCQQTDNQAPNDNGKAETLINQLVPAKPTAEDKTKETLYKEDQEPLAAWVNHMALEKADTSNRQVRIKKNYLYKMFESFKDIQRKRKMGKIMSGPLSWDEFRNLKFASYRYGFPIRYSPLEDFLPSRSDPDHEFWLRTMDESIQECGNDDACIWTKFKTAHIMKQLLSAALNQPYDMDYEKLVFIVFMHGKDMLTYMKCAYIYIPKFTTLNHVTS